MTGSDWAQLSEPWERLRWARLRWQREGGLPETMGAAAERLGMRENTYSAYERAPDSSKHSALDHHHAIQFGRCFKVNWAWLLTGDGSPFAPTLADQRAARLLAQAKEEDREMVLDMLEAALRRRAG